MPLDFSGIPEHAERKDSTRVSVTPDNPSPWPSPISFEGDRVIVHYDVGDVDITKQWDAWLATQTKVHSVTFEWTEEA